MNLTTMLAILLSILAMLGYAVASGKVFTTAGKEGAELSNATRDAGFAFLVQFANMSQEIVQRDVEPMNLTPISSLF